tara:strand:- start:5723 stop:6640 length:918 start_codon:yes stop_codon:yes gene_type:complete
MKTTTLFVFASIVAAFFTPIVPLLILVGFMVMARTYSDVWKIRQRRKTFKTRCPLIKKTLGALTARMPKYQIGILSFYAMDFFIFKSFGSKDFFATKVVATVLMVIEFYYINANVKEVKGVGVLAVIRDIGGWVKEVKKDAGEILKLLVIALGLFGVTLVVSCTTIKNAERRHDKIVKNFPSVHKGDTVEIEKTVEVIVPPKIIKGETIFEKCPEAGETITDSVTLDNGTKIKSTLTGNANGTKTLKTDVSTPAEKIAVKIKEKQPIIYERIPLKWWQRDWVFTMFLILAFFWGFGFCKILDKKQ